MGEEAVPQLEHWDPERDGPLSEQAMRRHSLQGRLVVRSRQLQDRVQLEIEDNGVGIPQENLTKIFSHGFTTKRNGRGFGLHSCGLVAQELNAALSVTSDGPGQGATFTLRLPIEEGTLCKV